MDFKEIDPTAPPPEGKVLVYTAFITLKNGKRLYASAYGKKAFAIYVNALREKPPNPTKH